ncbi:MAG: phosphoadenylyl-sulfate reductase [Acidimicrobiales bacterium]
MQEVSEAAATARDSDEALAALSERFETAPAPAVLEWALGRFGPRLVVASSFQDLVLVDLAVRIDPGVEVVFLDTGAHFPETLQFVDDARRRYRLNLTVTEPGPEAAGTPCGAADCCQVRKVAPLRGALAGKEAWVTGLKRVDAPTRAAAPIVAWDDAFDLVKVNPLATWTDDDVEAYLAEHGIPVHPLVPLGYLSIGCAPTTRPVAAGEDQRAGRWSGTGKVECGLHV